MEISLPNNWTPRPYQRAVWNYLESGGKRAVLRWHRRSGKDDVFLHHVACAAHQRVGNYWYMLPEYSQARKSMWDAINPNTGKRRIDDAFPLPLRKSTKSQEMMIEFRNGSTFQLVGSDNFNSLVGSPPIGLVFSEYALSNPSSWAYLMPIVEENGGWVGFNSTPRGKNHFKKLCEVAEKNDSWFYQALTAEDTGIFSNEQLLNILEQLQANHGDDYGRALWLQEYFVSFDAAIPGSIWGDCVDKAQNSGRIGVFPYNPSHKVFTGWDLGYTDDTAIWFYQVIDGQIYVIDYYEDSGKDIEHYSNVLFEKDYDYGTHWLPHDARPRTLASGGKSILQQFHEYGKKMDLGRFLIAPRLDREEGIQAARATFPLCHFDEKTEDGVEKLRSYHRQWDDELKVFAVSPVHDFSSHAADAWRTVAVTWKHAKLEKAVESDVIETKLPDFGMLKKQHFRRMRELRET